MKKFNTTGVCVPNRHYMVDTSKKLNEIICLIEDEEYFTINRSRQYGKTTTLYLLKNRLKAKYEIINISFEGIGDSPFLSDKNFAKSFIDICADAFAFTNISKIDENVWYDKSDFDEENPFRWLGKKVTALCKKYEIILMVDEMDKCSDNQVFLNFLGLLRKKYLSRNAGEDFTFKSVILAGVYDVKNLKLKLRPEEEKKYNSPWNIAVDFNVDMSFHPKDIATMLREYESDVHTGMDIDAISEKLYYYTNGYPYLVSWLCKWIDSQGEKNWTNDGIVKAVKHYHCSDSTLKDDLIKNYENNKSLKIMLDSMIFLGREYSYVDTDEAINLGLTFGIFRKKANIDGKLEIANIIFTNILTEHVLIKKARESDLAQPEKSQFIKEDGHLDMIRILDRFQALMKAEYRKEDEHFIESQGRLLFLCFLKPIINGTGFYYVEPETRSSNRMDIVVTYLEEEFIIELKIWHGEQYRKDGIKQLNGYLESRELKSGYLVSFSFLKNKEYKSGYLSDMTNEDVEGIEDKEIYEVVV